MSYRKKRSDQQVFWKHAWAIQNLLTEEYLEKQRIV